MNKLLRSPLRPSLKIRRWRTLLISLSAHLGLLMLAGLVLGSRSTGTGPVGPGHGDGLYAIWIPSSGSGSGGAGSTRDTVLTNDEATQQASGNSATDATSEQRPLSLLAVTSTDPDNVFTDSEAERPLNRDVDAASDASHDQILNRKHEESNDGEAGLETQAKADPVLGGSTVEGRSTAADFAGQGGPGNGSDDELRGSGGGHGDGQSVSFFGIVTRGRKIVYVIDASQSMSQHQAIELARTELWNSLRKLPLTSQFQIIFFDMTPHLLNAGSRNPRLLAATERNLRTARQFMRGIQPDSGTDRRAALTQALALEPEILYLLTDADDPVLDAKDLWEIKQANKRGTQIHVVEYGLGGDLSQDSFLKKLARQNRGTHHYHDLSRPRKPLP